jgi:hypothetical protein
MVQAWKKILILSYLETICVYSYLKTFFSNVEMFFKFGGLGLGGLVGKLVNMGFDVSSIFQGH